MKKSKLIDLFGLSKNPQDNDQLDDLIFRLELEEILTFSTKHGDALPMTEGHAVDSFIII
ncbi:MAG: hypothetical protein KGM95_00485 [Betaproteobacteria bacterium]|nr:hypothetical protein [Betaproteobacteria bacterium]